MGSNTLTSRVVVKGLVNRTPLVPVYLPCRLTRPGFKVEIWYHEVLLEMVTILTMLVDRDLRENIS
jgi:hypothetical protein